MTLDSAWIFRICLCITVLLILFADFFGSGNVADAISDDGGILNTYSIDNNRKSEKGSCGFYYVIAKLPCLIKTSFLHVKCLISRQNNSPSRKFNNLVVLQFKIIFLITKPY